MLALKQLCRRRTPNCPLPGGWDTKPSILPSLRALLQDKIKVLCSVFLVFVLCRSCCFHGRKSRPCLLPSRSYVDEGSWATNKTPVWEREEEATSQQEWCEELENL